MMFLPTEKEALLFEALDKAKTKEEEEKIWDEILKEQAKDKRRERMRSFGFCC